MSRSAWWIAVVVTWLVVPVQAWACSCIQSPKGLVGTLKEARDQAGSIYLARVRDSKSPSERFATVDVLQTFKGSIQAGDVLKLPYGRGGDCVLSLPPGQTWLIYADVDGPTEVTSCSRTRRVDPDDSELKWLRTGVLPPVPVSLQREIATCELCEINVMAGRLLVPPGVPPAGSPSGWNGVAESRWKAGQPFFTYAGMNSGSVLGISQEGRAFELTDTSDGDPVQRACQRRIQLRWCKRLAFEKESRFTSGFRCVDPGEPQELCDERRTRKAEWLPMERLPHGGCRWYRPDAPTCYLSEARFPFPAGSPALPVLACHALSPGRDGAAYTCEVKLAPEP
ncbi:hypothetical protein D7X55_05020 [Corallococcus sp. AB049A]|uniref:Lipoprotein n=1 Tax=Corallococcus interemptor TaxID=2316720 RepID=A0A3A8QAJ3_9BACT|nr:MULTISPECIES: hypothetical protein [Corallococcus]RKH54024.1 hypothetical protein D7Y23_01610 [Corallococcus sp. AB050B]RKH65198.1 hypothetical protein D7X96_24070 [Corallococcus interemptor]RKI73639.1 hypothetical protein D7X55_05020 [Corallococcus sp. AB049A]